jgi:hypothetical protein|tara:strand:- start:2631 stop:2843 length:213 start_codon:yes stop_codon:yes gene_type:complete
MPRYHNINGVQVQFTAEEEAKKDAEIAQDAVDQETRKTASDQRATDKANAKAKLIAGEALTEAEADTIVL